MRKHSMTVRSAAWRAAPTRAVALGTCLLGLGVPAGSIAPGEEANPLGVVVESETDRPATGAEVRYEIKVRNDGPSELPAVVVSQLLPPALTYLESDAEVARRTPTQVQWVATVPAGEAILIVMRGQVGEAADIPKVDGERRLSTTVCVAAERGAPLAGCATDSDRVGPPSTGADRFDNALVSAVLIGAMFCGGGGYLWYRIAAHRRRLAG